MVCPETYVRQVLWLIIDRFGDATSCGAFTAGWLHSTAHCLVNERLQAWLSEDQSQKPDEPSTDRRHHGSFARPVHVSRRHLRRCKAQCWFKNVGTLQ